MEDMHISLLAAGIAGLIVIFLAARCGIIRTRDKIMHGDGGNVILFRRMRAQANFTEYTPLALVLIVLLDLMAQDGPLLAWSALAFLLGRVLHAFGMDAEKEGWPRALGMVLTIPPLIGWSLWALLVGARVI